MLLKVKSKALPVTEKIKSNFVESTINMNSFFKHLPEPLLSKKIKRGDFPFSQYLFLGHVC
jgi:hypothetical protein